MTDITAKVIADSISPQGKRITTLQLRYPRFIHSEFMTHRMFSRNASSSRAIPVNREIDRVIESPALPIHVGKNKPGMQAHEEVDDVERIDVLRELSALGEIVADRVDYINKAYGVHKQVLNRYLEPWLHIDVVVTATEWDNFFHLRDNDAAEPHIRLLAQEMKNVIVNSIPTRPRSPVLYHMPYWTRELTGLRVQDQILTCAARCARVSYRNHDGRFDADKDIKLARNLYRNGHWSPFEHIARPADKEYFHANFRGWRSLRNLIESELYIVEEE